MSAQFADRSAVASAENAERAGRSQPSHLKSPNPAPLKRQPSARRRRRPIPLKAPGRVTMRSLLGDLEFRLLTVTQFLSLAGDQLARVALSVLVFDRTNSALQAAIAYALTFIPAVIGGPLLCGLADRRPRRSVMIAADLARAPLIALIAVPAMPLAISLVLLATAGLFEAPFASARGALLPDVLPGDRYPAGYAMSQIVIQVAQVGGFGLAGLLLIAWTPATLLIIDAATFLASAGLIYRFVQRRPAAHLEGASPRDAWWTHAFGDLKTSVRIVLGDSLVRPLVLLAWASSTFAIGFEALGAPLSRASGSASWSVGVLLAAQPAGTVLGALLAARVAKPRRTTTMQLLALLTLLPLVAGLTKPSLAILIAIGVISGLGLSFHVLASAAFVARIAPEVRGRALGLVGTGLLVGQGLGVLAAGVLASSIDARLAMGWLGVVGTLTVLAALLDGERSRARGYS